MNEMKPGRGRIFENLVDTVGNTPLVRLSRLAEAEGFKGDLLGKLEFFNPLASVKDRIGMSMIEAMERDVVISAGTTLIEPTSGNTGIALAFVAAAKGYRLILTMPESMSLERRKMLQILGAELILTPAELRMDGCIAKAEDLLREIPNSVMPQQFQNPANPEIHRMTTAQEIWNDSDGKVDIFISGVGTGGTITGCGEVLKCHNPEVQIVAVEPEDSPVLSGGEAGPHKIQGIGAGFIPEVLNRDVIDEILTIGNESSFEMARRAAALEGLPIGISSGAALAAAIEIGLRPQNQGKSIVVIIPSFAERYLSTPLFDGI